MTTTNNHDDIKKALTIFSTYREDNKEKKGFVSESPGNKITIRETQDRGEQEVSFVNGTFIKLNEAMLDINLNYFNKKVRDTLGKRCDGIFLVPTDDKILLCLVELKQTINNKFNDAIKQIEGSYLKTAMLLGLSTDINELEPVIFIGGNLEKKDTDYDYLEKVEEFRGKPDNLYTTFKELSQRGKTRINLPIFLSECIHGDYPRKRINVYHIASGGTFDLNNL